MRKSSSLPEHKRIVTTDNEPVCGHELAQISERLPGEEPTGSNIRLNGGPTYEARYWRCLNCGEERNRRREFHDHCRTALTLAQTDGGYSIAEARTRDALTENMAIHPDPDDGVYSVRGESRVTHRVNPIERTCTCSDSQRRRVFCKHLRRVDIEVRTGTVPDVKR